MNLLKQNICFTIIQLQIVDLQKPVHKVLQQILMLAFENIKISFNAKTVVSGLSFSVSEGRKAVISGESGAGKSSLLNTLTGFVRPDAGSIRYSGKELNAGSIQDFRTRIAYLPQQISFNNLDVKSFIEMPFRFQWNKSGYPSNEKVIHFLSGFGLRPEILNSTMQEISGGEKQRIALISCILLDRSILLLDEPTSALDSAIKTRIMDFLFQLSGVTIISASHDPEWVERCDQVIRI